MDITKRIDEILALAGAISGAMKSSTMGRSPSSTLRPELNRLFSIFLDNMRVEKNKKKAIAKVVKQEDLNKNWEKSLKKFIKQTYK